MANNEQATKVKNMKACSVCNKEGVPLKQIDIPFPPFHLFYCKVCWDSYWDLLKHSAEQKKKEGKGMIKTARELVNELKEKKT